MYIISESMLFSNQPRIATEGDAFMIIIVEHFNIYIIIFIVFGIKILLKKMKGLLRKFKKDFLNE